MKKMQKNKGFTLIEVLIAIFMSGLLFSAGLSFYSQVQSQTTIQMELSNIQSICRSTMDDIKSTLRQAGFKLSSHDAFLINGDSLMVFSSDGATIDTVGYYLASEGYNDDDDDDDYEVEEGSYRVNTETYRIIKRDADGNHAIYSDNIVSIAYNQLSSNRIQISITAQAELPDEAYSLNNGYRRLTLTEEVCLRNI